MRLFDVFKNETSRPVKFALVGGGLLVLFILIGLAVGLAWHFSSSAYEKREAEREALLQKERAAREQERAEKEAWKRTAEESGAQLEVWKSVAEPQKIDRQATIQELEKIEAERNVQKQTEGTIDTLSVDQLRAELCARMRARGKPCPE